MLKINREVINRGALALSSTIIKSRQRWWSRWLMTSAEADKTDEADEVLMNRRRLGGDGEVVENT